MNKNFEDKTFSDRCCCSFMRFGRFFTNFDFSAAPIRQSASPLHIGTTSRGQQSVDDDEGQKTRYVVSSCRRGQAWRHQSIRLGRPHSWVWYKYPIRRSHLIDTDQKGWQKLSHFAHLKIYHLNLFEKLCDTWIFFQWFCFQNIHCL